MILPIAFTNIKLEVNHFHIFFICETQEEYIDTDDQILIFKNYQFFDRFGQLMIDYFFDSYEYMGVFDQSENYLYLITIIDKTDLDNMILRKGIISLKGYMIYEPVEHLLRFQRRTDDLIVLVFGHIDVVEEKEVEVIDKYDKLPKI
jgi:hypothetical protein